MTLIECLDQSVPVKHSASISQKIATISVPTSQNRALKSLNNANIVEGCPMTLSRFGKYLRGLRHYRTQ